MLGDGKRYPCVGARSAAIWTGWLEFVLGFTRRVQEAKYSGVRCENYMNAMELGSLDTRGT